MFVGRVNMSSLRTLQFKAGVPYMWSARCICADRLKNFLLKLFFSTFKIKGSFYLMMKKGSDFIQGGL
jgi:hypothetical protein